MACKTDNFKFDPDKSALENLFALIYRTNRVKLNPKAVEVGLPRALEEGEDRHDVDDNTIIVVKSKKGGPFTGNVDLYYARADICTHYPDFEVDLKDIRHVHDKSALIAYLDGRFNLVDGEFDVDIEDPFHSMFEFTGLDLYAKETSLIYIGDKQIHLYWSEGVRRVTDEGRFRITDEGQIRYVPLEALGLA